MGGFVQEFVGLIVWLVANGVYVDLRRRGRRGFLRLVTFWSGLPGTWISLIFVREGSQPDILPPPDDEDALLAEIRRERALRPPDEDAEHIQEPPEGT